MPPHPKVHAGVAAIIVEDGKLLMIHRWVKNVELAKRYDGHNQWSVPGGWIEHGEDFLAATKRETLEEVGVEVVAQGQMGSTIHVASDGSFTSVCTFVQCELAYPQKVRNMEPEKVGAVEWVPLEEVSGRSLFEPLRLFLDDPLTLQLAMLDRWES